MDAAATMAAGQDDDRSTDAMTHHAYVRTSQPPKRTRQLYGRRGDPVGLGVESQRAALLERWPHARVWVDAAKSGRSGNRPALLAMLAELQPGDVVCVTQLDRLARCTRLAMWLEHEVEVVRRCRIVSASGEGTSETGEPDAYAVFARRVSMAAAELQAAQAAAATRAAMRAKRDRGDAAGMPAFGWHVVAGRLAANPTEQAVLRAVLELTNGRPGRFTGAELASRLNEAGFRTRSGGLYHRTTARRLAQRADRLLATDGPMP